VQLKRLLSRADVCEELEAFVNASGADLLQTASLVTWDLPPAEDLAHRLELAHPPVAPDREWDEDREDSRNPGE
jgi:hypothetical protein